MTDARVGTPHTMAMAAPLTKERGLREAPCDVGSNTRPDGPNTSLDRAGIPDTLDNMTVPQRVSIIAYCNPGTDAVSSTPPPAAARVTGE